MKRMVHLALMIVLFPGLVSRSAVSHAAEYSILVTKDYREVQRQEQELSLKVGAGHVLVVLDLDNTTLKTRTDLASEQWFNWQTGLLKAGTTQIPAVAPTIEGLLVALNMITKLAPMDVVDPQIVPILRGISARGAKIIALTSRNVDLRDATLRELSRNGIFLSSNAELKLNVPSIPYIPYDLAQLARDGLSANDAARFALPPAKQTVFDRGVFFTDGQHKGVMLRTLLAHMRQTVSGILFVDDRLHHHEGMRDAFEHTDILLRSVQYLKMEQHINEFNKGSKDTVKYQWCAFAKGLEQSIFFESKSLPVNSCH